MARLERLLAVMTVALVAGSSCSREAPSGSPMPPDAIGPAQAVERALDYLTARSGHLSPKLPPVVDYLARKFEVEAISYTSLGPGDFSRLNAREATQLEAFRRLVDLDAFVEPALLEELAFKHDRLTTMALHCDRLPLPLSFPSHLEEATRVGGYRLTHAVMAAQWALENGCVKALEIQSLHADQVARLELLIEHEGVANDVGLEAIAMLYYSGEADRVAEDWVRRVVASQRPDGGWAKRPDASQSHDHTTVLGLWVLLEHLHPEAPAIAMVPQPIPQQAGSATQDGVLGTRDDASVSSPAR